MTTRTWEAPVALALAAAMLAACGSAGPAVPGVSDATPAAACTPRAAGAPPVPDEPLLDSPPSGTSDGTMLALDAASGAEQWRRTLPMAAAVLSVLGNRLVVNGSYGASQGGVYVSLDAATGAVVWRWPQNGWLRGSGYAPISADDEVVVAAGVGLTVLDAGSGTPLWGQSSAALGAGTVAAGNVILPAAAEGSTSRHPHAQRLVGYAACTGQQVWSTGQPALLGVFGPVASGQAVTAYVDKTGPGTGQSVVRVDAGTGRPVWRIDLAGKPEAITLPVLGQATVLGFTDSAASKTSRLALDPATGRELWRVEDRTYWSRGAEADGRVYFVALDGHAEAIAADTGHRAWRTSKDRFTVGAAAGGGLVLLCTKDEVVALDGATGHERWRHPNPREGLGPTSVAVNGDTVYVWGTGKAIYEDE